MFLTTLHVKGKKVRSLCLTKHHAMKTYWANGGTAPCILDLSTRWRWVVSFTPQLLYLQGWVCPRVILDTVVERKIPSPCQELNPRTPIVQPIAHVKYKYQNSTDSTPKMEGTVNYLCLCHMKRRIICKRVILIWVQINCGDSNSLSGLRSDITGENYLMWLCFSNSDNDTKCSLDNPLY
jgi:hypothetical protein